MPTYLSFIRCVALAGAIAATNGSSARGETDEELAALKAHVGQLHSRGQYSEAIPIARKYADAIKARDGEHHPNYGTALNNLAAVLQGANQLSEAEPVMRQALAIDEKLHGPDHPSLAADLNNLAVLLQDTGRFAEAETFVRRGLAIEEASRGGEHPLVAIHVSNLARLLYTTNRLAEAEPLLRRALAIFESSLGPDHPQTATALSSLAVVLFATKRHLEAERLLRRALAIDEARLGPDHPNVARELNNLASLLKQKNRASEAEPLFRRALAINLTVLGPDHPSVAMDLHNLAGLLSDTRPTEAEPLYRRALAIAEKTSGPEHPDTARNLGSLAALLLGMDKPVDAEPLMLRAIGILDKSLGAQHPETATARSNLAVLRGRSGDWPEAAKLHRQAAKILIDERQQSASNDRLGLGTTALTSNTQRLRAAARAVYHAGPLDSAARAEGFELAQWALQTAAAEAIGQMSLRFAKGEGPFANLVGRRQSLLAERGEADRRLLAAIGKGKADDTGRIRDEVTAIDAQLDGIDQRLASDFAEYADLAIPKPLTIAALQALLKDDEAAVVFLDMPEETLAWVVTKDAADWKSIPLGTSQLFNRVAALRCGLDSSDWDDASAWPIETDFDKQLADAQQARRVWCEHLLGVSIPAHELPPFDLIRAHGLYAALFAPFADLTKGKRLILVPSGPLTGLPFHVLVTSPLADALPFALRSMVGAEPFLRDYRRAAWFALQQPITVLPSVASIKSLRQLPPSQASEPYAAFGNPLLNGDGSALDTKRAEQARDKQRCRPNADASHPRAAQAASRASGLEFVNRGGSVDLAVARRQHPLPETADELCAVARSLDAIDRQEETIWLGARATEKNLKLLSREGKLSRFSVLHFATHGLLSGESATVLGAKAEPALLLTPPPDGATASDLEEDDGLLTASEVAQLKLDADWVVLSACNTAAGADDTEALSGLARAFFFARSRSLLVSYWYVSSDAAVKLTTGAFDALKAKPTIGRSEALRRSMNELITKGSSEDAHPAMWAPFVLVGDGR